MMKPKIRVCSILFNNVSRRFVSNTGKQNSNDISNEIMGKATIEGTENFIVASKIELHHRFSKTGLCINPVIHGPPRLEPISLIKNIDKKKADEYLFKAVIQNNSNMIYVYNHYSSSHEIGHWHSSNLASIMNKETSA
jgi:hypothetical protein